MKTILETKSSCEVNIHLKKKNYVLNLTQRDSRQRSRSTFSGLQTVQQFVRSLAWITELLHFIRWLYFTFKLRRLICRSSKKGLKFIQREGLSRGVSVLRKSKKIFLTWLWQISVICMQLTAATGAAPAHKDPPTAEKHTERPVEPRHVAATAADCSRQCFVCLCRKTNKAVRIIYQKFAFQKSPLLTFIAASQLTCLFILRRNPGNVQNSLHQCTTSCH